MKTSLLFLMISSALLVFACGDKKAETVAAAPSKGQQIWQENCAICHQQGLGGAPMIGNKVQWQKRVAQGLPTLIEHALNGYSGNTGEMPPRGGNPKLTDEEVTLAATYMVSQVTDK